MEHIKIGPLPPLSFEVADGECLAVDGPSGSGKTRLLRALADLDEADGRVFLDGAEQSEMPAPQWRALVRYVSSEPAWWTATVRASLADDDAIQARVIRIVTALGLTVVDLDRPVVELSTGERQRMSLARALADDPRVLLLDEPTSGLDAQAVALVEEVIRFRMLSGKIVLLASHDLGLMKRLADQRLVLAKVPAPARVAVQ